jgi:flagellar motor switch protein FliG
MSGLGQIDRATLADIVGEFTGALDNLALIMPRGMHDALEILNPHISAMARDGLQGGCRDRRRHRPMAPPRGDGRTAQLRPILDEESAEICAILLSKLNVAKAAALLSDLPPDRAEVIAHAVSLTDTIPPETALRIGEHLHAQIVAKPKATFDTGPVDRVGAMLNAVGTASRDAVLAGLEARDADFADGVRRAIFTFQHIPKRIDAADIPRITGAVDGETLVTALAYGLQAAPLAVEFILENMSRRMAEQMRDEAEAMSTPKEAEGEAAMQAVVAAIRGLEEAGDIRIRPRGRGLRPPQRRPGRHLSPRRARMPICRIPPMVLEFTEAGIYCPAADIHIDPWRPVPRALITHGHSDHARPGHGAYLATSGAAPVIRHRLGDIRLQTIEYGENADRRRDDQLPSRGPRPRLGADPGRGRRRGLGRLGRLQDGGRRPLHPVRARALPHLHQRKHLRPADLQLDAAGRAGR